MHNQFQTQKFKHLMLAMGPRDLNFAPYSPVHCSRHSMTSFQSSELTELPVSHSARTAHGTPPLRNQRHECAPWTCPLSLLSLDSNACRYTLGVHPDYSRSASWALHPRHHIVLTVEVLTPKCLLRPDLQFLFLCRNLYRGRGGRGARADRPTHPTNPPHQKICPPGGKIRQRGWRFGGILALRKERPLGADCRDTHIALAFDTLTHPSPAPCVTFCPSLVSLPGPVQSPVLPFTTCVGSSLPAQP